MIGEDSTAAMSEGIEIVNTGPSADIGRVDAVRKGGGGEVECVSIPGGVAVDDIFEPVLGVVSARNTGWGER
jgi:hypothetical protein